MENIKNKSNHIKLINMITLMWGEASFKDYNKLCLECC